MRHALLALALTLAACTAEPEPIAPAVEPAPAAPAPSPAEPEPVSPVALTATLTVDGDTVTVTGTSNLPNGAALVWQIDALQGASSELRALLYQGERIEGSAQVEQGSYSATVTRDGWDQLALCDALPLELWVSYYPLAELAERGAIPAQPDSLYALHGEQGELIPGAVPPAELVELPVPEGSQRVELVVTCP